MNLESESALFYDEQKRKIELAQELYGMDESSYSALVDRVTVYGVASLKDIDRFEDIRAQWNIEQGHSV